MTHSQEVLNSMSTALSESGSLPDRMTYTTFEIDQTGGQANVRPPIVEMSVIDSIRVQPHNTDFVGFKTDDDGNQTGRIFAAQFELSVQIDVWTAAGDNYDPYELGSTVRSVLYEYDTHMVGNPLPDPDDPSQNMSEIEYLRVGDGSVANDLSMSPALRRWRQTADVWFRETITTDEPEIDEVALKEYEVNETPATELEGIVSTQTTRSIDE